MDFGGVILYLQEFAIYLFLCACLLMEEIFTENNAIILQLAIRKMHLMMPTEFVAPLSYSFKHCGLLIVFFFFFICFLS